MGNINKRGMSSKRKWNLKKNEIKWWKNKNNIENKVYLVC